MISSPLSQLKPRYDVIVIGSGYGGSIAASRLARSKNAEGNPVSVCLLERGAEIPVGAYPEDPVHAADQFQVSSPDRDLGRPDGLYWLHVGKDISVMHGCGLGGTSLINANVSLPPDERVWDDPRWPSAIRADRFGRIEEGFRRAREMLAPNPCPRPHELKKYRALVQSAGKLGASEKVYPPPINVTFEGGTNVAGIHQPDCTHCGNCVSGCNVGSKNTLLMNYLPDAKQHGAEIFCRTDVRFIEPTTSGYRVFFRSIAGGVPPFDAPNLSIEGSVVVVAAGTLGSTEILLRSRDRGLRCSRQLGSGFSGNGDVLGFAYNNDEAIHGIGRRPDHHEPRVGPCISGIIDLRDTDRVSEGFVIEEGAIPAAIAELIKGPLALVASVSGTDTDEGFWDALKEQAREWRSALPNGAYAGAMANTQTFLVMSHDGADGQLALNSDHLEISWPGVGVRPIFGKVNRALIEATAATGGTYVPSPTFNKAFDYDLVSVHALGGCRMGENATVGATNHKGQVYDGGSSHDVYAGLYVLDGAVIPCSIGVNPLLTICAIAERNVRILAEERGWQVDETMTSKSVPLNVYLEHDGRKHLQFTERMAGHCSASAAGETYEAAEARGKQSGSSLEFILTISTDDIEHMLADPEHEGEATGTVRAPLLSSKPLTVHGGNFNLFVADPEMPGRQLMRYRLPLQSVEGERFFFDGFKQIQNDPGVDLWSDTTTLYVTLYEGWDATGQVKGRGVIHIDKADFAQQLTTMKAWDRRGDPSPKAVADFGALFAKDLWQQYGLGG